MVSATGPIPADKFRELIDAPYGAAAAAIRQYDPMWGRKEGETIKWRVTLSRQATETASVIVEAETADEAEGMVDDIPDSKMNWEVDHFGGDYDIDSVEAIP